MNFDQSFYSNFKDAGDASGTGTQINETGLVGPAYKDYQAAIDATKTAKKALESYKSNYAGELKKLIDFYTASGNGNPIQAAQTFTENVITELVKRVNDAIIYEEAKRQAYISIAAANGVATYETVATQQITAKSTLTELQTQLANATAAASAATGLKPTTLAIIAAVVVIIVLVIILKK